MPNVRSYTRRSRSKPKLHGYLVSNNDDYCGLVSARNEEDALNLALERIKEIDAESGYTIAEEVKADPLVVESLDNNVIRDTLPPGINMNPPPGFGEGESPDARDTKKAAKEGWRGVVFETI